MQPCRARLLLPQVQLWLPNELILHPKLAKTMNARASVGSWLSVLFACVAAFAQQPGAPLPGSNTGTGTTAPVRHEDRDPLLDLPELPDHRVTLIGGRVVSLDEVMNRMVVQPFGGKHKITIAFDSRTRFFRDGAPITQRDIHQAQRVYVDTMLNGSRVFAKSIWIQTQVERGISRGQITDVNLEHKTLTVRDELSQEPVRFQLGSSTSIHREGRPATMTDLREGMLVALSFSPGRELSDVSVLATPGSSFSFAGRVTYLDLSRKLIAIANQSDGKNYDIYTDAIAQSIMRQLREGSVVTVSAVFDGNRYSARQIEVSGSAQRQE